MGAVATFLEKFDGAILKLLLTHSGVFRIDNFVILTPQNLRWHLNLRHQLANSIAARLDKSDIGLGPAYACIVT